MHIIHYGLVQKHRSSEIKTTNLMLLYALNHEDWPASDGQYLVPSNPTKKKKKRTYAYIILVGYMACICQYRACNIIWFYSHWTETFIKTTHACYSIARYSTTTILLVYPTRDIRMYNVHYRAGKKRRMACQMIQSIDYWTLWGITQPHRPILTDPSIFICYTFLRGLGPRVIYRPSLIYI